MIDVASLLTIGSGLTFVGCLAKMKIDDYVEFWTEESVKVQEIGYIAPKPGWLEANLMHAVCTAIGLFENGPADVIGRENIPRNGRVILALNHIGHADVATVSAIVGARSGRFLIHRDKVPPRDITGILLTMSGAIAVEYRTKIGRAKAGIAAVEALIKDGSNGWLVIFPQGNFFPDERIALEDFKPGTAKIAQKVAEQTQEPVYVLTGAIHYEHDGKRANQLIAKIKRYANAKMAPEFGADTEIFFPDKCATKVVLNKPFVVTPAVPSDEDVQSRKSLPHDEVKATQMIYEAMKSAHDQAVLAAKADSSSEFLTIGQWLAESSGPRSWWVDTFGRWFTDFVGITQIDVD